MTAGDGQTDTDYELGNRLAGQSDLSGAEEAFRRADERGHPAAATSVGMFAEARGDIAAARAAYERADQRGDRLGATRLGLLVAGDGDWEQAQTIWRRSERREASPAETRELDARLFGGEQKAVAARPPEHIRSPLTSPVLVGTLTVLIAVIGMVLAFSSNRGLPFVPTRELKVDIGDGSNIVAGNDVREGGFLVGLVSSMKPVSVHGQTLAQLTLKLNKSNGPVPVDSTFSIYSKSVLGLKYVNIHRGISSRMFADGATVPVSRTNVPVQLDQVFDTFTTPTRQNIERGLVGFGDALAGRGSDLNDTFHSLPSLLTHLQPVAAYLSAPATELTRFLDQLNGLTTTLSPVAGTLAQLFADQATTFGAIARSPQALEQTIARSPATLQTSITSLRAQQPFLADFASLGRALTPATAALKGALPVINPAIAQGTRVLPRTVALDARLQGVFVSLKNLAQAPGTNIGVNALTHTAQTLDPMLKYLGPFITVCNDWNYWWANLAGDIDEATSFGYAQRALLMQGNPAQPNNVSSIVASGPANGGGLPSLPLVGGNEYLHAGPVYNAAIDNAGNADCEAGQRGFPLKLNYFDPQGRKLGTDQHVPGNQGPTFSGQAHVPAGESFSRNPLTGPQTPYNPSNP
ncbi:MAG: MlaD family protein [Solirubrobacteraceae bacterium]